MRTVRKHSTHFTHSTRSMRYEQYSDDNDGGEINEYQLLPSFEPYQFRRTSRLFVDEGDDSDVIEDDHCRTHTQKRTHHARKFVRQACDEVFKCRQCRRFIGPPPSGGRQRNHCPFCLYSLHVDGNTSGDRKSTCGSRMEPIGSFQRAKGEYVLVHRCLGCGFERFNRIAADDDFDLVLALPVLPGRTKHTIEA